MNAHVVAEAEVVGPYLAIGYQEQAVVRASSETAILRPGVGTQDYVHFAARRVEDPLPARWLAYVIPCQRFAETLAGNCA